MCTQDEYGFAAPEGTQVDDLRGGCGLSPNGERPSQRIKTRLSWSIQLIAMPWVFVPWIRVDGMLDTAFEQIHHYSANNAAVSLRLLRAIGDIAGTLQRDDTAPNFWNARVG